MTVLSDTLVSKVQQGSEENWIIEHISDSRYFHLEPFGTIKLPEFAPIHIGGITIDLSITKNILMMMLVSVTLTIVLIIATKQNKKNRVPTGFGNLVEMLMIFLKDEIVLPSMGKAGLSYLPFFFTLFVFVLSCNLFGLLP